MDWFEGLPGVAVGDGVALVVPAALPPGPIELPPIAVVVMTFPLVEEVEEEGKEEEKEEETEEDKDVDAATDE